MTIDKAGRKDALEWSKTKKLRKLTGEKERNTNCQKKSLFFEI